MQGHGMSDDESSKEKQNYPVGPRAESRFNRMNTAEDKHREAE
jgi:hypothetical protein